MFRIIKQLHDLRICEKIEFKTLLYLKEFRLALQG